MDPIGTSTARAGVGRGAPPANVEITYGCAPAGAMITALNRGKNTAK
jgi:hypothetical protein